MNTPPCQLLNYSPRGQEEGGSEQAFFIPLTLSISVSLPVVRPILADCRDVYCVTWGTLLSEPQFPNWKMRISGAPGLGLCKLQWSRCYSSWWSVATLKVSVKGEFQVLALELTRTVLGTWGLSYIQKTSCHFPSDQMSPHQRGLLPAPSMKKHPWAFLSLPCFIFSTKLLNLNHGRYLHCFPTCPTPSLKPQESQGYILFTSISQCLE